MNLFVRETGKQGFFIEKKQSLNAKLISVVNG